MGETSEQLIDAVFALRDLETESIPVNFLMPFDGTPLEGTRNLTPLACLRILALGRLACPDRELCIAGGREIRLRSLQSIALEVANPLFLGDYLTSESQAAQADLEMIADAGFVVLGQKPQIPETHCLQNNVPRTSDTGQGNPDNLSSSSQNPPPIPEPALRRRGTGTTKEPNA